MVNNIQTYGDVQELLNKLPHRQHGTGVIKNICRQFGGSAG